MTQALVLVLGLLMIAGGIYLGVALWSGDFWMVLKGLVVMFLVIIGLGVVAFAISSIRDMLEEKRMRAAEAEKKEEAAPPSPPPSAEETPPTTTTTTPEEPKQES